MCGLKILDKKKGYTDMKDTVSAKTATVHIHTKAHVPATYRQVYKALMTAQIRTHPHQNTSLKMTTGNAGTVPEVIDII